MKDETGGVAVEEFVGLKPKMHSFLVDNNSEYKQVKGVNRNVVATISHIKMYCLMINISNIHLIECKIKTIKQKHMKSTKFYSLVLMTKYVSKTMDMMDQLLLTRFNQKKLS